MRQFLVQLSRFSTVGAAATLVHVATALAANSGLGMTALRANLLAFAVSSAFSFFGNWRWTFEGQGNFAAAAPRFAAMQAAALAFNQAIVYLCTVRAAMPLWLAMVPLVILVPAMNFWLGRNLVFKPRRIA